MQATIDIETVLVRNAGNAPDIREMNDDTCCYGSVPYEYHIGKYEVTNDQFTDRRCQAQTPCRGRFDVR